MVWVEALLPKVVDGKVFICLSTEESMHQARRWGIEFLGRIPSRLGTELLDDQGTLTLYLVAI